MGRRFFLFALFCVLLQAVCPYEFGVSYGRKGDNLPSPDQVVDLLRSHGIHKVKLFEDQPALIAAFADSGIDLSITIPNEKIAGMAANPAEAETWVQQHVQPFFPRAHITYILVGNEVDLAGHDIMSFVVPAMQSVQKALAAINLDRQVIVSTTLSYAVMDNTYPHPPSACTFRQDLVDTNFIKPVLDFISQSNSPLVINPVPFFSYKSQPDPKALPYMLFQPNTGSLDPATNLRYDNLLYAHIDSVYAALDKIGHADIKVLVGETGWPSMGDEEPGVSLQNAAAYNGNLIRKLEMREGTPLKPSVPVEAYIFALFNENQKSGPTSERNWGLFNPDGSLVYDIPPTPSPSPPTLPPRDVIVVVPGIPITVPAGKELPPSVSPPQKLLPSPKASPPPPPPPTPPSSSSSKASTSALSFWIVVATTILVSL